MSGFNKLSVLYLNQNVTPIQRIQNYNSIAEYYDQENIDNGYTGHVNIAKTIDEYIAEDNKDIEILDMACGTGLVGAELVKLGYRNIDGFDPAENMLKVAKERNVYRRVVCQGFLGQKLDLEDGVYDVACASAFPNDPETLCQGFIEMIRVVKDGGYVILALRKVYAADTNLRGKLRKVTDKLEKDGHIKTVLEKRIPNLMSGVEGDILLYRKERSAM